MKKAYSHHDRFMVWQIKNLLEVKGIPCFIKNEFAIGAIGELSPIDALPEVWISDNEWWPKTQQVISEFELQPQQNKDWYCAQCQEQNDANFEVCWQCGTDANTQT